MEAGEKQKGADTGTTASADVMLKSLEKEPILNDGGASHPCVKQIAKRLRQRANKWSLIITMSSLVLVIAFITVAFLVSGNLSLAEKLACSQTTYCTTTLVETTPSGMQYPPGSPVFDSIADHWKKLIRIAQTEIDILSFYWSLNGTDLEGGPYPQAKVGEEILNALADAATSRSVNIRIVQLIADKSYPQLDTQRLSGLKNVYVRSLNMTRLVGAGIIHTKAWIVDGHHLYVGSANLDFRSLTEVKELGVMIYNCECAAEDLKKVFEANWLLATPTATVPKIWPDQYRTDYNKDHPLTLPIYGNVPMRAYFSASPPQLAAPSRSTDIDALIDVIGKAQRFVYIAVMDYAPAIVFAHPKRYWPVIDEALRAAAYDRGVDVKFLAANWSHTGSDQWSFLRSLTEFSKALRKGSLEVKKFEIPQGDVTIPYTRVNHDKYMVTDNAAFVTTSNWQGDYFTTTGGVSIVANQTADSRHPAAVNGTIQEQLRLLFLRDWTSQYAVYL